MDVDFGTLNVYQIDEFIENEKQINIGLRESTNRYKYRNNKKR